MSYPFPPLADLSLNAFDSPELNPWAVHQSTDQGAQWPIPTWQSFDSDLPSTSYAWPACTQFMYMPELAFPPSSPSDTSSTDSLRTESVHIVCNAPLVAPIPLPYHSPTFLQFDLPDIDEDLSHPPYTRRPSKRKHDGETGGRVSSKRRTSDIRPSPTSQWHSSLSNRSHHHLAVKRPRPPRYNMC